MAPSPGKRFWTCSPTVRHCVHILYMYYTTYGGDYLVGILGMQLSIVYNVHALYCIHVHVLHCIYIHVHCTCTLLIARGKGWQLSCKAVECGEVGKTLLTLSQVSEPLSLSSH